MTRQFITTTPKENADLEQTPHPRGEKTVFVRKAVKGFSADFSVADVQKMCPGVGIDMSRRVFKDMQHDKIIECISRGNPPNGAKPSIR